MRNILIILLLIIGCILNAQTTFYVSTTGSDSNTGLDSTTSAWATWQKAINTATPGDTVYIRGGTYDVSVEIQKDPTDNDSDGDGGVSGKPDSLIYYFNFPNEVPIMDFSNHPAASSNASGLYIREAGYIHIKGITFQNLLQTASDRHPNMIGFNSIII